MHKKLNILFLGTPDFAAASLEALIQHEFNIVAVVTAPDKPSGRGLNVQSLKPIGRWRRWMGAVRPVAYRPRPAPSRSADGSGKSTGCDDPAS